MPMLGPSYGFGLYIHWPYCARICPYCDFNVYAAKDRDTAPLVAALVRDIEAHKTRLPTHPALTSVFFGGGTPSLLSSSEMAEILAAANDAFGLAKGAEITLEANPNDVLRGAPSDWTAAGINRLSLGIQSLDDEALSFLGRDHDVTAARSAVAQVQSEFDNHSVDLIYARPDQTETAWAKELTDALALGAPHLSLYELTIEARTAFGRRAARGELIPMPDEQQADLYERTQQICDAHGLPAYEISNHARGRDFESVHNHIYWASGDWIGVGPGAHGRLTANGQRLATEAAQRPNDYLDAKHPETTQLDQQDIAHEYLAMALRPLAGMDLARFESLFGAPPDADTLRTLEENDLAEVKDGQLRLSVQGRLMADYIAGQLAP